MQPSKGHHVTFKLFLIGPLLFPWRPAIEFSLTTSSSTILFLARKCLRRLGPSYPHVWSGHFFTEWWSLFFLNFSSLFVSLGFVSLCLSSSCCLLILFSSSVWHTFAWTDTEFCIDADRSRCSVVVFFGAGRILILQHLWSDFLRLVIWVSNFFFSAVSSAVFVRRSLLLLLLSSLPLCCPFYLLKFFSLTV